MARKYGHLTRAPVQPVDPWAGIGAHFDDERPEHEDGRVHATRPVGAGRRR